MDIEFQGFGKIPRLSRECIISEKIDGTNAQVLIELFDPSKHLNPLGVEYYLEPTPVTDYGTISESVVVTPMAIYAGSKSRIITPDHDNHGFARWVKEHTAELVQLGPGRHFGEWWGQGIQRAYGLKEKRFSLFNTSRWGWIGKDENQRPECCHVVPVLWTGLMDSHTIEQQLWLLAASGSHAAPGYMNPEGVVIFHTALNGYFKKTIKDDEVPKGKGENL